MTLFWECPNQIRLELLCQKTAGSRPLGLRTEPASVLRPCPFKRWLGRKCRGQGLRRIAVLSRVLLCYPEYYRVVPCFAPPTVISCFASGTSASPTGTTEKCDGKVPHAVL